MNTQILIVPNECVGAAVTRREGEPLLRVPVSLVTSAGGAKRVFCTFRSIKTGKCNHPSTKDEAVLEGVNAGGIRECIYNELNNNTRLDYIKEA